MLSSSCRTFLSQKTQQWSGVAQPEICSHHKHVYLYTMGTGSQAPKYVSKIVTTTRSNALQGAQDVCAIPRQRSIIGVQRQRSQPVLVLLRRHTKILLTRICRSSKTFPAQ